MIDKNTDFYSFQHLAGIKAYKEVSLGNRYSKDAFITIIITTYNRPLLVFDAIHSALNQATDIPFNILILDNCSEKSWWTDSDISLKDTNIRIVRNNENLGMFGNMNQGALLAETDYISFLHDDDLLYPDFVGEVFKIVNSHPNIHAIHVGMAQLINGEIISKHEEKATLFSRKDYQMTFSGPGAPTGLVVRRNTFIELGGFNSDYYPTSDFCFCCLIARTKNFYSYTKPLCIYRVEENESMKIETLTNFVTNDRYLREYIYNSYRAPRILSYPVVSRKVIDQIIGLRNDFNKKFLYKDLDGLHINKNISRPLYLPFRLLLNCYLWIASVLNNA